MGRFWWPSRFDATLGFPGEGHPTRGQVVTPLGPTPGRAWLRLASKVLHGRASFGGQPWIAEDLSSETIHEVLLSIALEGNSRRPIAARVQSHPDRVASLLGTGSHTTV